MLVTLFSRFRFILCLLLAPVFPKVASATTVVPPEFPTLVNESDYILHARVTDVRSEWRKDRPTHDIVTYVTLEVLEVVAGNPPVVPVLRFLGGRIGDEFVRIEGSPQFAVGDEDILFVRGNGRSLCPLYAMGHGRYPISTEVGTGRREVHLSSGLPLTDVAAISEPLHGESVGTAHDHGGEAAKSMAAAEPVALTASAFITQIRAAVRPGSRVTAARVE